MGHHYVPREHLRRFAIQNKSKFVWMYDKHTRKYREAAIRTVAQENGYYDLETESALAEVVEGPGKKVIDKLLKRDAIDNAERTSLSLYFMIMLSRGPRQRKKSFELVPGIREKVIKETEDLIRQWITDEPGNRMAHHRLQELELARKKFSDEIPQNVMDIIRRPHWSEQTVECIYNMCWHIMPAPLGKYFVTGDTPAHSFESLGLRNLSSEYTISLSKDLALIGDYKRKTGIIYERLDAQVAKEVNRRILSHTERFVFSPRNEKWIDMVAQKNEPYLSHISRYK
ncbi:DUF4238 domain-containing protein [Gimesia sp.]|uniref:DUF4238 domain-containing protein n=1 Tax=Gimesia sp. TaxID=2024833 RepID=UPI003A92E248